MVHKFRSLIWFKKPHLQLWASCHSCHRSRDWKGWSYLGCGDCHRISHWQAAWGRYRSIPVLLYFLRRLTAITYTVLAYGCQQVTEQNYCNRMFRQSLQRRVRCSPGQLFTNWAREQVTPYYGPCARAWSTLLALMCCSYYSIHHYAL
jgi:hypothetical protein